jgi:hypothetical protein
MMYTIRKRNEIERKGGRQTERARERVRERERPVRARDLVAL